MSKSYLFIVSVEEITERLRGFIQDISLEINIERMKLYLINCTIIERLALLHHDSEQVDGQGVMLE